MAGPGLLCQPLRCEVESFVYSQSAKVNSRFDWRSWSLQHQVAPSHPLSPCGERKHPLLDNPPPARFPTPPSPALHCTAQALLRAPALHLAGSQGLLAGASASIPSFSIHPTQNSRGAFLKNTTAWSPLPTFRYRANFHSIHHVQHQCSPLQKGLP